MHANPRLLVGTSGFSYKEWKGSFYPSDLPDERMLAYYSERLPAVEINNTFYRMPKPAVVERWRDETRDGFVFVIKASRRITHQERLQDSGDSVAYLMKVTSPLGDKLGAYLFQLPPFLRKDVERLHRFLELLPEGRRAVLEFRHVSWLDDEVVEALREHGAALCVADGEKVETPVRATADFGYLRLRREDYSDEDLQGWAATILQQDWREVFVFFKHEDAAAGPSLAERFAEVFRDQHSRS